MVFFPRESVGTAFPIGKAMPATGGGAGEDEREPSGGGNNKSGDNNDGGASTALTPSTATDSGKSEGGSARRILVRGRGRHGIHWCCRSS